MGKILFWVLAVLGALIAARLVAANHRKNNGNTTAASPTKGQNKTSVKGQASGTTTEAMVRCAHCGIYMPRSEALLSEGQTWCSAEHARLGVRT